MFVIDQCDEANDDQHRSDDDEHFNIATDHDSTADYGAAHDHGAADDHDVVWPTASGLATF